MTLSRSISNGIILLCVFCSPLLYGAETENTTSTKTNKEVHQPMTTASLSQATFDRGCILRGPQDKKQMAIQFTGDQYADGAEKILKALKERNIKATFYFTGNFYRNPAFKGIIQTMIAEGHYLGPHGDQHLLYATWENPPKLLIDKKTFTDDLKENLLWMERNYGITKDKVTIWNPAYQHYTQEVCDWGKELGLQPVNYTPGTRTMCDYMLDNDPKYLTSREMIDTAYKFESTNPNGMNGFIMHMHIGAGPFRTKDHLYDLLPEMLDELAHRGYSFVSVDELLKDSLMK